jgi:hypothetical protein
LSSFTAASSAAALEAANLPNDFATDRAESRVASRRLRSISRGFIPTFFDLRIPPHCDEMSILVAVLIKQSNDPNLPSGASQMRRARAPLDNLTKTR